MGSDLRTVSGGHSFLEGPRWHDGRLWVSDFYTARVLAIAPEGGTVEVMAEVPNQPSGLGWLPDGRLLVVSMKDHKILRQEPGGELVVHADLSAYVAGHCNDMVVDSQGRAYVGNFGFDLMAGEGPAPTVLVRADPDGTVTVVADDLRFPNGPAITPDGSTLILAETMGNRISCFAIADDGSLGPRQDFARFGDPQTADNLPELFGQTKVAPDGMSTVDAEGCVWAADALGQRVVRVAKGKGIVDEISSGELSVFACALGGADGRTLFLCAAPTFHEAEAREHHQARLLATEVPVPAA